MGIGGGDVDKPLELALAKAWAWATAEIQKHRTGCPKITKREGKEKEIMEDARKTYREKVELPKF